MFAPSGAARDALAFAYRPTLAKIPRQAQLQQPTTTCQLTSAALTMVRTAAVPSIAMRVLMQNTVRLKGLQPHAGAPHPEARPQHLCWRVW
jgi:hypothetical protein